MSPDDRDKLIKKIRKCLALAGSSNPNEAAVALRQARAMMAAAEVSDVELDAAEAEAAHARATCSLEPHAWEAGLANAVGDAFGVYVLFRGGSRSLSRYGELRRNPGAWSFIGTGAAPQVASYSMSVLLRLARKARGDYRAKLGGMKPSRKNWACDSFSRGWTFQVAKHLADFAAPTRNTRAISAYLKLHHPNLQTGPARGGEAQKLTARQLDAVAAGAAAAKDVRLRNGVGQEAGPASLGQTLAIESRLP